MRLLTCLIVLLVPLSAAGADKATKETFGSGGRTRTYYLLVPESAKKAGSPPLMVLLHGSEHCRSRASLSSNEPHGKLRSPSGSGPTTRSFHWASFAPHAMRWRLEGSGRSWPRSRATPIGITTRQATSTRRCGRICASSICRTNQSTRGIRTRG